MSIIRMHGDQHVFHPADNVYACWHVFPGSPCMRFHKGTSWLTLVGKMTCEIDFAELKWKRYWVGLQVRNEIPKTAFSPNMSIWKTFNFQTLFLIFALWLSGSNLSSNIFLPHHRWAWMAAPTSTGWKKKKSLHQDFIIMTIVFSILTSKDIPLLKSLHFASHNKS